MARSPAESGRADTPRNPAIARLTLLWAVGVIGCSGGQGGRDSGSGDLPGTDGDGSGGPGTGIDPSITTAVPTGAVGDSTDGDSEGGTTADDTGEASTAAGETEGDPCTQHWRVQRAEGRLEAVAHDPVSDVVYAAGATAGADAWAMAIDACSGRVLADSAVAHPQATDTYATALVVDDGEVFVAGSITTATDPGEGWYAGLDPTSLSVLWSTPLFGSDASDDIVDITATASGRLWMSGGTNNGPMGMAWGLSASAQGEACGFPWGGAASGSARAVAADGGDVTLAIRTNAGSVVLATYDPTCTCMCMPTSETVEIEIGTNDTSIGELLATGGQFYLVGWASDTDAPGDLRGHATWLSSSGIPIELYQTDPTTDDDGFLAAATDGDHLYLGGLRGWQGDPGFGSADGLVEALPLPLDGSPAPDFSVSPTDLHDVVDLAVQDGAEGWLFVGGNAGGAGVVVRCDKSGNCGEP